MEFQAQPSPLYIHIFNNHFHSVPQFQSFLPIKQCWGDTTGMNQPISTHASIHKCSKVGRVSDPASQQLSWFEVRQWGDTLLE